MDPDNINEILIDVDLTKTMPRNLQKRVKDKSIKRQMCYVCYESLPKKNNPFQSCDQCGFQWCNTCHYKSPPSFYKCPQCRKDQCAQLLSQIREVNHWTGPLIVQDMLADNQIRALVEQMIQDHGMFTIFHFFRQIDQIIIEGQIM